MAATRTPDAAGERLYSIQELATLWSVSRDTIERLMRLDELRWIRFGARRRIPASAIEEYLDRHRAQ